jgi:cytochrome c biogenesis protein CcmG/thiol:disulfide interchange protein DsbE
MQPTPWPRRSLALVFLIAASYVFLTDEVYFAPKNVQITALDLRSLDGLPVSAQPLQGKPVVLNFWAPWCAPCRLEIPWLQRLQHDHPEVAVIGVEDDADQYQQAKSLVAQTGLTYLMVRPNDALRSKFGHVVGLPTTLYISASGNVVHTVSGVIPESVMAKYLHDAASAH